MINIKEIFWLAGILEGEGNFRYNSTPGISVGMSDIDTIEKIRVILKTNSKIRRITRDKLKEMYYIEIYGTPSIQWMMTIYSLMSIRRKEKIREIIIKWKNSLNQFQVPTKGRLVKNLMKLKNISRDEALNLINISLQKETIQ